MLMETWQLRNPIQTLKQAKKMTITKKTFKDKDGVEVTEEIIMGANGKK